MNDPGKIIRSGDHSFWKMNVSYLRAADEGFKPDTALSRSTVRFIGVLCTVGDGELLLASDPTRVSRQDFPPVARKDIAFLVISYE